MVSRPQRLRQRARIVLTRFPSQANRPFSKYGPPPPTQAPTSQGLPEIILNSNQRPREPTQWNSESDRGGLILQGMPSPTRDHDFAPASPIASQNNEPFDHFNSNYLPPRNQKLPAPTYTASAFSQPEDHSSYHHHQQPTAVHVHGSSQNYVQQQSNSPQISDAAHFLTQNAQAISQLYGAPAENQNYEPQYDEPSRVNSNDLNIETEQFEPLVQQSSLPTSYSLNNHEAALQQTQSLPPSAEDSALLHRYAQLHGIHQGHHQLNSHVALSQGVSTFQSLGGGHEFAVQQQANNLQAAPTTGGIGQIPSYGSSYVPTFIPSGSFIPSYGVFGPSQPSGSPAISTSPTHFGLPIPTLPGDDDLKPSVAHPVHTPVTQPINPAPATPPIYPAALHPQYPSSSVPVFPHPQQHPTATYHPVYQPTLVNTPPVYRPVKPIYTPIYYYPSYGFPSHRPPVQQPWSYAPAYAQAKSSSHE